MDDATVKLINTEFVPLAHHGWGFGEVLTARGEVVAPRLVAGDTGGPDGKNNPLAPKRLRAVLEKFKRLPPEKRLARVEDLPGIWKGKALPQPPAGGLILRQYRRTLHRNAEGRMSRQALRHDFLWMTRAEWRSLVPKQPRVGDSFTAPPFLVSRIAAHHAQVIVDAGALQVSATPKPSLTFTVEQASPEQVRLRVRGSFQVTESQSYEVLHGTADYQVHGCLEYDVKKKTFRRFDLAALGEVTNFRKDSGPPKGKTMLGGLVFELCPGATPWERTPPGRLAFGGLGQYFKAGPGQTRGRRQE
jgi:hypothetical protein